MNTEILEVMGDDHRADSAARVSVAGDKYQRSEAEVRRLLTWLLGQDPPHTSPFEHSRLTIQFGDLKRPKGWMHELVFKHMRYADAHLDKYRNVVMSDTLLNWIKLAKRSNSLELRDELYDALEKHFPAAMGQEETTNRKTPNEGEIPLYGGQGRITLIDVLYGKPRDGDLHKALCFRIETPLPIRSQHVRYRTWSFNEISRRYTSEELGFHIPKQWRKQGAKNLQCSDGLVSPAVAAKASAMLACVNTFNKVVYDTMLNDEIAREQARFALPQSTYTRYYATGKLADFKHFLRQRLDPHAQPEIREIAIGALELAWPIFKRELKEFEEYV